MATFPSFEVLPDGRSLVSVFVRGPVKVTEQKAEGRLVYVLEGVAVSARVNRMPLLTQEFPTQVGSVSLESGSNGANLIIELREKATATYKVADADGGTLVSVIIPKSEKYGRTLTNQDRALDQAGEGNDSGDDDDSANLEPGSSDVPTNANEETERRRKHSRREPKPYVMRPLTLPHMTLAPDIAISVSGFDTNDPATHLSGSVKYGIIDQLEVEATPNAFRLAPRGAYAHPSLGFTAGYTGHVFEIGGRARYFLGLDSEDLDNFGSGALLLGIPMRIHLSTWGRIDTGGFMTLDFDKSTFGAGPTGDSGVRVGLTNTEASPFIGLFGFSDTGIPFNFLFQPAEAFWFGIHGGLAIYDFSDVSESLALPLGAEIGFTASDDFNPNADLGIRIDFPQLIRPASDEDKFVEKAYSLGVWFRWYYHI